MVGFTLKGGLTMMSELFNKKLNRQQTRRVHKLTGKELQEIKNQARYEAIGFTVNAFQKVMENDFGFGAVRMGRVAEGIYKELGIDPEEV